MLTDRGNSQAARIARRLTRSQRYALTSVTPDGYVTVNRPATCQALFRMRLVTTRSGIATAGPWFLTETGWDVVNELGGRS